MKKWLYVFCFCNLALSVTAAPFLVSDPQAAFDPRTGSGVSSYEISTDSKMWGVAGSREVGNNQIQLYHDIKDAKMGETNYSIRVLNKFGDRSIPVPFVLKREVPPQPGGIRVTPE